MRTSIQMQFLQELTQLKQINGIYTVLIFLVFIAATLAIGSLIKHFAHQIIQPNTRAQKILEGLTITCLSAVLSILICGQLTRFILELNN